MKTFYILLAFLMNSYNYCTFRQISIQYFQTNLAMVNTAYPYNLCSIHLFRKINVVPLHSLSIQHLSSTRYNQNTDTLLLQTQSLELKDLGVFHSFNLLQIHEGSLPFRFLHTHPQFFAYMKTCRTKEGYQQSFYTNYNVFQIL